MHAALFSERDGGAFAGGLHLKEGDGARVVKPLEHLKPHDWKIEIYRSRPDGDSSLLARETEKAARRELHGGVVNPIGAAAVVAAASRISDAAAAAGRTSPVASGCVSRALQSGTAGPCGEHRGGATHNEAASSGRERTERTQKENGKADWYKGSSWSSNNWGAATKIDWGAENGGGGGEADHSWGTSGSWKKESKWGWEEKTSSEWDWEKPNFPP